MIPTILEQIRRCHHCNRVMHGSAKAYAENPFCRRCFKERTAKERGSTQPVWSAPDGNKVRTRLR